MQFFNGLMGAFGYVPKASKQENNRQNAAKSISFDDLFRRSSNNGHWFSSDRDPLEAYSGAMPWVAACVDAITRGIVSQDFYFTKNAKEISIERVLPKIALPFQNKWHGVDFYAGMRLIVPNLLLTGNAYLWRAKSTLLGASGNFPDTFVPVPSSNVTIKINDDGEGIAYYQLRIGVNTHIVPPDEIIHFKQNAIYSPFVGVGNITKLRLLIQGEQAAAEYLNSVLIDAKKQPTTIILDGTEMTPEIRSTMVEQLRTKWSEKMLLLPVTDATLHQNSMLTKDFDFLAMRKDAQDVVTAIFGVPKIVLGLPESSNRATSTNQFPYFYRMAVNPRLLEISDAITSQHVAMYDKELKFNFRKHVSGDVKETIDMLTNGIITPNQAAERLGETPDPNSKSRDLYYRPSNWVSMEQDVQSDEALVAEPSAIPTEGARKDITDPRNVDAIVSNFEKSAIKPKIFQNEYLKVALKTRNVLADKFVMSLSDYFTAQGKEVLKIVAHSKKDIEETEAAEIAVIAYIVAQKNTEVEVLKALHTSGVQRAVGDINLITGAGVNPMISNPFVKAAIDKLGEKITGKITETTLKELRAIFKRAMTEGMTINEIQDEIQAKFSQFSTTRARMIARTEARAAWDAGAYVSYTDLGVKTIDIVGCTMFEANSDCGKQGIPVHRIPFLSFHPNHIGVVAPSEQL